MLLAIHFLTIYDTNNINNLVLLLVRLICCVTDLSTYPRMMIILRASRLPFIAARWVGVFPSSSGWFISFRFASRNKSRYPSRAARWNFSAILPSSMPLLYCMFDEYKSENSNTSKPYSFHFISFLHLDYWDL